MQVLQVNWIKFYLNTSYNNLWSSLGGHGFDTISGTNEYDVVIVGAGPAGLFIAYEFSCRSLQVLIVDTGKDIDKRHCPMFSMVACDHCTLCSILCGVGGSGAYSDGTLNLRPDIHGTASQDGNGYN